MRQVRSPRAGVQARLTPGVDIDPSAKLTLEQMFLNIVGSESGVSNPEQELTWLG